MAEAAVVSAGPTRSTAQRAAVIGSGFGGLACAIRLQASGIPTVIYEARDQPGGRAYVYRDKGFTFDAGPTVITAPPCLEELFELGGTTMADHVEMLPVTPFYRLCWEDGDAMDYVGDTDAMAARFEARHAGDGDGYRRFVQYAEKVFSAGYDGLAATPFLAFRDMVKVAPQLMRLRADRSVYSTVARYVQDPRTRQALSFHSLLVGGNPFDTSAIYTLIHFLEKRWGVYFPRGGTGALVQALVRLFIDLGGEIRLSSPVQSIEVQHGVDGRPVHHVTSQGHGTQRYNVVVSNADLHHTYGKLYKSHARAPRKQKALERMKWSMSLFVLYFGVDRVYPDVAHHSVILASRYKELLRDIFNGPDLPEDYSLYLHAPSVTDPSLAPPGSSTFYVLSPVPHLGNAPVDWDKVAPVYADRILATLEQQLPDLRKHVVTKRWFTPNDFQSELHAYQGSAFSVAPLLTQSAWFRPHNKDPEIPGLYIVGAGTHPGAGVPGVVNSAKATASLVIRDVFGVAP